MNFIQVELDLRREERGTAVKCGANKPPGELRIRPLCFLCILFILFILFSSSKSSFLCHWQPECALCYHCSLVFC
jgi:hypothetical protein